MSLYGQSRRGVTSIPAKEGGTDMVCRVYTVGVHQNAKQYEVDVILSDRVVRGALGQPSEFERAVDKVLVLRRRTRKIPAPGLREPHAAKQYLVNQFNSAMMDSPKRQGYTPIDLRQFRRLNVAEGRCATLREHAQYLVLGLVNIPDALTPQVN